MKYFVQLLAGIGIALFLIGAVMKIQGVELLLNAMPQSWWRASMTFISLGILYALIEIRDELRTRSA